MATTLSVTQALAELKLLDKRIRKCYERDCEGDPPMKWMAVRAKTTPVDTEQLKREAQADWQRFTDLVERRDRMKKAIVKSNATTEVKVGAWTGTVAEAIEHKAGIAYKKEMLLAGRTHLAKVTHDAERAKQEVQTRLDRLLQSELGKDVRTNPETIQSITTSFLENNKVEVVDPLGLKEKLRRLEEEVEEFETNVDWVLSESNGRTMITV